MGLSGAPYSTYGNVWGAFVSRRCNLDSGLEQRSGKSATQAISEAQDGEKAETMGGRVVTPAGTSRTHR